MAAVVQVRSDETRPFPHPQERRRRRAMALPEGILAERQRRKRTAARLRPRGAAPLAPGAADPDGG